MFLFSILNIGLPFYCCICINIREKYRFDCLYNSIIIEIITRAPQLRSKMHMFTLYLFVYSHLKIDNFVLPVTPFVLIFLSTCTFHRHSAIIIHFLHFFQLFSILLGQGVGIVHLLCLLLLLHLLQRRLSHLLIAIHPRSSTSH